MLRLTVRTVLATTLGHLIISDFDANQISQRLVLHRVLHVQLLVHDDGLFQSFNFGFLVGQLLLLLFDFLFEGAVLTLVELEVGLVFGGGGGKAAFFVDEGDVLLA